MGFSELVAGAEAAMQNQRYFEAVPLMQEIIRRAGEMDNVGARESVQTARLQLGMAMTELQKLDEAKKYLREYLEGNPVTNPVAAYQLLSRVALAEQDWEGLFNASNKLVEDRAIGLRAKETAQQFLVQALFNLGRYQETLDILPGVIERSRDADAIRAYRIMQIRSLNEIGRADEIITKLPTLFRSDARDDVSLNLTLLRIGDTLFDRQEYRKALAVYRLVVSKEALLAGQEARIAERARQGRPEDEWRIDEMKLALEQLREIPDYDIHIAYRAAQIYTEHKRFWEAVALFEKLYDENPGREEGLAALLQKILILFDIGAEEQAVQISLQFLDNNRSGFYPRIITMRLMQHYVEQEAFQDALGLLRYVDSWDPPADQDERMQEVDLRYMISFVYFQLGDYAQAISSFDQVIQLAPESMAGIDSRYWKAMCELLRQDYVIAYALFTEYRQRWPNATFASAALFRAGVCRFGMEDYDSAKQLFRDFIEQYPTDSLAPEAMALYGDLLGADGFLDEAVAQYQQAIALVERKYSEETNPVFRRQLVAPATYAMVQAARTLELDAQAYRETRDYEKARERFRKIIELAERYTQVFGTDSDYAQSIFWIGKAQMELGDPSKAVAAYLDAVLRFGGDPAQEGVAAILFELAGIIDRRLDPVERDRVVETVRAARQGAEEPALQIRLEVLLAELDGTRLQLGYDLLMRYPDPSGVPPSGLALMVAAMQDAQDFSRAEEFFNLFRDRYDGSVFMKNVYRLRAEDLYRQQKLDEALALATGALARFGIDPDLSWAQLMKGNIEMAQGRLEEAEESFKLIFGVGAWRGAAAAEATFRTAEIWERQGHYDRAFAFYQRTYLLYKAHAGGYWAAEAYLRSAECLRRMNRPSAMRNTYRAMLLDEYVRDLPQAQIARDALGPDEVAELLVGRTNRFETVEAEVNP